MRFTWPNDLQATLRMRGVVFCVSNVSFGDYNLFSRNRLQARRPGVCS